MTREDLSFICMPILAVAIALKADIGTPTMPADVAGYVSWVLTGIIAGLTPIVGPVIANMIQGGIKREVK